MTRAIRILVLVLFSLTLVSSLFITGCTRYAKEEQLTTLDETEASADAAEQRVAEKEQEKAELEAKLEQKKQELKDVQAEKEKVRSQL
jgi:septal ring factor EnvC (AmiA/AmiB activator)